MATLHSTPLENEVLDLVARSTGSNVYHMAAKSTPGISNGFTDSVRGGREISSFELVPTVAR